MPSLQPSPTQVELLPQRSHSTLPTCLPTTDHLTQVDLLPQCSHTTLPTCLPTTDHLTQVDLLPQCSHTTPTTCLPTTDHLANLLDQHPLLSSAQIPSLFYPPTMMSPQPRQQHDLQTLAQTPARVHTLRNIPTSVTPDITSHPRHCPPKTAPTNHQLIHGRHMTITDQTKPATSLAHPRLKHLTPRYSPPNP